VRAKIEGIYEEAGALSDDDLHEIRVAVEKLVTALGGEATW